MDSITIDDVRQLVTSAGEQLTAAEAAAEAGWFHQVCFMTAASVESALLAQVYAFEPEIRAAGLWKDTDRPLTKWTLDRLIQVAVRMSWLPSTIGQLPNDRITETLAGEVGDAVRFVQYMRNIAGHPGKHVAEVPWLTIGKSESDLVLGIADAVFERLKAALNSLES